MAELIGGSAGIQLEKKGICKQLVLPLIAHPSGFMLLLRYVLTGNKYNFILRPNLEKRIKSPLQTNVPTQPIKQAPRTSIQASAVTVEE